MNYLQAKKLFSQTYQLIDAEKYLEALQILVKISSAQLFYKNPPFDKHELIKTAEMCCKALQNNNKEINEAKIGYGVILRNSNMITESINIFESILEQGIQKEVILENAYSLELFGDNKKALNLLLDGLKKYPYEKMILNNIATLYEIEEEWDLALNYYNLALEIDDKGGISHYNKGRVLYVLEQYDQALYHFEKAQRLYENNDFRIIDVYIFLADTHLQLKHYKKAEIIYNEIISLFPKRSEGYYSISDFYYNIGNKVRSLKYIEKAINLSFPQIDYYHKKAYILNDLNQSKKALFTIKKAKIHFPNDVKLLDLEAEILNSQNNYAAAIKVYQKRLEIDIQEDIFFYLADCFFNLQNYSEGFFWINRYIKTNDKYSEAYILRAKINAITGYYHLALDDLKRALTLENNSLHLDESDWYYFENLTVIQEFHEFLKEVEK
ncbi:MAG: tetratricopeptide repeat protein [Spirochaetota bacterium]|nr:tetratricopeptide repeat protein [Spirochaetota bacterium]